MRRTTATALPVERRGLPGARVRGTPGNGGRELEPVTVNGDLDAVRQDG